MDVGVIMQSSGISNYHQRGVIQMPEITNEHKFWASTICNDKYMLIFIQNKSIISNNILSTTISTKRNAIVAIITRTSE